MVIPPDLGSGERRFKSGHPDVDFNGPGAARTSGSQLRWARAFFDRNRDRNAEPGPGWTREDRRAHNQQDPAHSPT